MKYLIFIILSFQVLANDDLGLPLHVKCGEDKCFMQVISPYQGPKIMEQAGMSLSYSLKKDVPSVIGFYLPADVNPDAGLIIKFIDTVPDGESFKLVPAEGTMARLPINNCKKAYCVSLVYKEIQSSDNSQMDLIQELKIREHVWLAFKRDGKEETLMLPTYKFRDELTKLEQ